VRTIYRDVDALSAAAFRSMPSGQPRRDRARRFVSRHSRAFDENEVRALFVSSDEALADIGSWWTPQRAREARARDAEPHPRDARQARGRVHVDGRRWIGTSAPSLPRRAAEAVWNDRCVTIAYSDRRGAVTRRTLEPFGLVAKAGVWYLIARDGET